MNRDSNIYTFLFVGIMVIGIASILAFTSQTLKPMQKENVKNEKMQNILSTVGINVSRDEAKDLYSKYITQELALKIDGTVNEKINPFSEPWGTFKTVIFDDSALFHVSMTFPHQKTPQICKKTTE